MSEEQRLNVLLIGFGAVGTLYAYLLQRGGARITAVCRSNCAVVKEHGIHIFSEKFGTQKNWHPDQVISSADELKDTAYNSVPDVRPSSDTIRPFLQKIRMVNASRLPLVVLIQNGIDTENEVYESLVQCDPPLASGVVGGLSWVGVTLLGEGSRIEHGSLERLKIGLFPPPLSDDPSDDIQAAFDRLVKLFADGGSNVEATKDIEATRWGKAIWNISWGGLCAIARQPVAALLQAEALPYTCGVVHGIMLELLTIARANGIGENRLPAATVDETYFMTLRNSYAKIRVSKQPDRFFDTSGGKALSDDFKPSILVDLERKKPMELNTIFGPLLRRARETNVATPRLDLIVAALVPSQLESVRQQTGAKASEKDSEQIYDAIPALNFTGGAPVLDY
ncbi:2-dehydropantoate 2-reductase [Malassezia yamatoensis]|uniref:2-dehydropantoate 2-reductase n=1 Tax=Malassezia yamatoensis TaxID=253288 RepID=A0AAJ5YWH2_9BASI|nr:2-dehydropantoate 2-reductase [Malassezia yamatoensis]